MSYTLAVGNHDQAAGGSAANFTSNIDGYFTPEELGAEGTYDGYETPSLRNNYTSLLGVDPAAISSQRASGDMARITYGAVDDILMISARDGADSVLDALV